MNENRFRQLPAVDKLLSHETIEPLIAEFGRSRVAHWSRRSIDLLRGELVDGILHADRSELLVRAIELIVDQACEAGLDRLSPVVNATGVLLHTNLGRAPLADRAVEAVQAAARYTNLEMDLASGERRYRGYQLESLWRELTGCEAAFVVNNCAAATLLTLQAVARGKEVVVSRGQLIEIGGSYRLPDVFQESGAVLREVGTTNRVRLSDYESAIGPETAALLRVHASNYRVVGFTASVEIDELAPLAHRHGLLAIDDIGSGSVTDLSRIGLTGEPTVGHSLAAGADLVLFSGDKLLGGPQCGVVLGKAELIARLKRSPLARAFRIDKLTLAALQATLEIHLSGRAMEEIPLLRQLSMPQDELEQRARRFAQDMVQSRCPLQLSVEKGESAVGGGSLPTATLPTWLIALKAERISAESLARRLRTGNPPVLARIQADRVLLDFRTILPGQEPLLGQALLSVL